ncbi:hypothetical protein C2G38_2041570 [Gigaspora rosea]|uniref:Uncharacterized protein n=1 Tax=Gigaspora rosea TaxID=44941 RepID=A0A397UYV5_9GLOM|nr:hypothetical protein C2G38_2041570 [Gigaspora rosea]
MDEEDNALEIKPINISALEKEENKVKKVPEDQELTYFSQKEKEVLANFNCKIKTNFNEVLKWFLKCANRYNLIEKYENIKDNCKQDTNMDKNEVMNKKNKKEKIRV